MVYVFEYLWSGNPYISIITGMLTHSSFSSVILELSLYPLDMILYFQHLLHIKTESDGGSGNVLVSKVSKYITVRPVLA
jgi:hypothetical protein